MTEDELNIYMKSWKHENNVPSSLLPRVAARTWAHDVWLHIAGTSEPKEGSVS